MLQQTQVTTVLPYFDRFTSAFPDTASLAEAPLDAILALWSGLGYYARARNLHKAAQHVMQAWQGQWPNDLDALSRLPGVGRSTAAAIQSQAFNTRATILDGNVKRVLSRFHAVGVPLKSAAVLKTMWDLAESHTPRDAACDYTQAIMDLGATLCKRTQPQCDACPLQPHCIGHQLGEPTQFPVRAPKAQKPTREETWYAHYDPQADEVLLEQRPPKGIWGGLWSLPTKPLCTLANHPLDSLGHTRHTFSHFHLDFETLLVTIPTKGIPKTAHQPHMRWIPRREWATLGLPSPVRTVLDQLEVYRASIL